MKGILEKLKCPKCGYEVYEPENLEEEDMELLGTVKFSITVCPRCGTEIKQTKSDIKKRIKTKVEFT